MELLIVNFSDIPGGISNLGVNYKHLYANEIYYRLKQYVSTLEEIPKEATIIVGAISTIFEYCKKSDTAIYFRYLCSTIISDI